jgi:hypothetical protein
MLANAYNMNAYDLIKVTTPCIPSSMTRQASKAVHSVDVSLQAPPTSLHNKNNRYCNHNVDTVTGAACELLQIRAGSEH